VGDGVVFNGEAQAVAVVVALMPRRAVIALNDADANPVFRGELDCVNLREADEAIQGHGLETEPKDNDHGRNGHHRPEPNVIRRAHVGVSSLGTTKHFTSTVTVPPVARTAQSIWALNGTGVDLSNANKRPSGMVAYMPTALPHCATMTTETGGSVGREFSTWNLSSANAEDASNTANTSDFTGGS
jgi:hypothetical protein